MKKEYTLKFIEEELKQILDFILYCSLTIEDISYLFFSTNQEYYDVIKENRFFFGRIRYSLWVSLVLEINKLFNSKEDYSIKKLLKRLINDYKNSEWKGKISLRELKEIEFELVDSSNGILERINLIRDENYAHLDRRRTDFEKIRIDIYDAIIIIDLSKKIFDRLNFRLFNNSSVFDFCESDKGHKILEELSELKRIKKNIKI